MDLTKSEEIDKKDKSINNLNTSTEMKRNVSYNAIITPGEASESDEDEEYVDQSERRFSSGDQTFDRIRKTSEISQSQKSAISDDTSSVGDSIKYNTLLHNKLREKNEQLRRELADLACGPYISATKEVGSITKQLIQSQKMVQNVSASLRKVSKELLSLEQTITSIRNDKNLLFNQYILNSSVDSKDNETNITHN